MLTGDLPPPFSSPAAALTLAASVLATRMRDVRAALVLPVDRDRLAVRFTIGFPRAAQQRAAGLRLDPSWLTGGAIRHPPNELRMALLLRESIVVPLSRDEPPMGALLVDSPRLAPADIAFACSVADLLGATLRQSQQLDAARVDIDLAKTLLRLTAEVNSTLPLGEMLHRINQTIVQIVGCDRSGTLLWSKRRRGFVPASDIGTPAEVAADFASRSYEFGHIPFEAELAAGRTVVLDRKTPNTDAQRLLRGLQLETMVIIPLEGRDQALGSLTASWQKPHNLTEQELSLLQGVARYAAVAIDTQRLFDRAAKAANFRDALSQLSLTVNTIDNADDILRTVCRRMRDLFRTEWAVTFKRGPQGLVACQAEGPSAGRLIGTVIAPDDTEALIARTYRDGRPTSSHAAGAAARFPAGFEVGSLVAVPLAARGGAWGALVLADSRPYRFNTDLVEEVTMAGVAAATAVENAQLLAELRQNSDTLAERSARLAERGTALESMNHELEDMLFIASHDLRAPLINIDGFIHELQRSVSNLRAHGAAGADDLIESMQFVRQNVTKMDQLINALIDLSELASSPLPLDAVDVDALARRLQREFAAELEAQRITLSIGTLPTVQANPARLGQLFRHLIDNAIRYMGESPQREIRVGTVSRVEGDRFYLSDTGPGMSQRDVEQVVKLFRRGQQRDVAGAGLGLTLAKKIVERHGGRMWLESAPGSGTTVWFTLGACFPTDRGT